MNIMAKNGKEYNVPVYEHYCDSTSDMDNIDPHYITLGSSCVVLNGTNGGLDLYLADSQKQWHLLSSDN